jgi:hypothetical protein
MSVALPDLKYGGLIYDLGGHMTRPQEVEKLEVFPSYLRSGGEIQKIKKSINVGRADRRV